MKEEGPEFQDPLQSIFSEILKNVDITVAHVQGLPDGQDQPNVNIDRFTAIPGGLGAFRSIYAHRHSDDCCGCS